MTITLGSTLPIAADSPAHASAARQARLADAAHQFEGALLTELLRSLQSDKDGMSADEDAEEGSAGTLRSYGTEAMARAISQGGGFGIARQVIAQVTSESHHGAAPAIQQNGKGTEVFRSSADQLN